MHRPLEAYTGCCLCLAKCLKREKSVDSPPPFFFVLKKYNSKPAAVQWKMYIIVHCIL